MILVPRAGPRSYFEHMISWPDVLEKEFLEAGVARNWIVAQPQPLDRIGELSFKGAHSARCFQL